MIASLLPVVMLTAPPAAGAHTFDAPSEIAAPGRAAGATVARIVGRTPARRRLGSARGTTSLSAETAWSHQPQVLLVLGAATRDGREWVKVLLASRPNGSTAWVRRDRVVLATTPYWVEVHIRARTVAVYRAGRRIRTFRAVVGARKTPTPVGLAAIYERNRQPDPRAFLGPWVLSLTIMSDVLENFGGGPGRVALHGRSGASLRDPLGSARSHGCIRLANPKISWLARTLPVGTPVRITRG
jgi:lipoprotein-anchoring transpeptidase ErfK/SrfK